MLKGNLELSKYMINLENVKKQKRTSFPNDQKVIKIPNFEFIKFWP